LSDRSFHHAILHVESVRLRRTDANHKPRTDRIERPVVGQGGQLGKGRFDVFVDEVFGERDQEMTRATEDLRERLEELRDALLANNIAEA
jgi:hypothetical protein